MKTCKFCGITEDKKEFVKKERKCKECHSKYLKEWRAGEKKSIEYFVHDVNLFTI